MVWVEVVFEVEVVVLVEVEVEVCVCVEVVTKKLERYSMKFIASTSMLLVFLDCFGKALNPETQSLFSENFVWMWYVSAFAWFVYFLAFIFFFDVRKKY